MVWRGSVPIFDDTQVGGRLCRRSPPSGTHGCQRAKKECALPTLHSRALGCSRHRSQQPRCVAGIPALLSAGSVRYARVSCRHHPLKISEAHSCASQYEPEIKRQVRHAPVNGEYHYTPGKQAPRRAHFRRATCIDDRRSTNQASDETPVARVRFLHRGFTSAGTTMNRGFKKGTTVGRSELDSNGRKLRVSDEA